MTSALMKPFSKSVWMTPAACGALAPLWIVQARDSFGPGGQVGLQAEGVEADAGELVEARLVLAGRGQQLGGVLRVEVDQLRLDLGVEEDGLRGRDQRGELGLAGLVGEHASSTLNT